MSYVYMRVLESAPRRYERGMRLLMLGRLQYLRRDIVDRVGAGEQILDIGCGTGVLAVLLARKGACVTGIDVSVPMLREAARGMRRAGLENQIVLKEIGAVDLDTAFPDKAFDSVVSTLVFSELSDDEMEYTLAECRRVLRPWGRLMIADEVLPGSMLGRIGTFLFRLPFVIAAFVLTQNTTRRVARLEQRIAGAGFQVVDTERYLLGTMKLIVAENVV